MKKTLTIFIAFTVLFSSLALIAQANTNNPVNAETHYGTIISIDLSRWNPPALVNIEGEDGTLHIHRLADVFILDVGGRSNRYMIDTDYDIWGPVHDVRDFDGLFVRYRVTDIGASGIGTIDLIELIDPLPPGRNIRPVINYRASGWGIDMSEYEPIITINSSHDERITNIRDGFSFDDYFLLVVRGWRPGAIPRVTSARDIVQFIDIEINTVQGVFAGGSIPASWRLIIEIPREFENSYIWVEINGDRQPIVSSPGPKPPPPPPPEPYPDIMNRVIFASPYDWQINNLNIQDANWGLNVVRIHSANDARISPRRTNFSFNDYFLVIISGWDTSTAAVTSLDAIRDRGYELNFELITEESTDPGAAVMVPWFRMIEIPIEFLDRELVMGDIRMPGTSLPTSAPTPTNTDEIRVLLNGTPIEFDVPPMIIDNRTMVPFRAIFEALGLRVEWDADNMMASGISENLRIDLYIGSYTAFINDVKANLDVPATIYNNRTMIPLRFIAEESGLNVEWNEYTRTIIITQN